MAASSAEQLKQSVHETGWLKCSTDANTLPGCGCYSVTEYSDMIWLWSMIITHWHYWCTAELQNASVLHQNPSDVTGCSFQYWTTCIEMESSIHSKAYWLHMRSNECSENVYYLLQQCEQYIIIKWLHNMYYALWFVLNHFQTLQGSSRQIIYHVHHHRSILLLSLKADTYFILICRKLIKFSYIRLLVTLKIKL